MGTDTDTDDTATTNQRLSLKWVIENAAQTSEWEEARERIATNPEEAREIDPLSGRTILHQLCVTSTSPLDLVELVASIFPEATGTQEKVYKATPLHVLCWTSQKSVKKVEAVLRHMSEDDVMLQNLFGGTALHSACGNNVDIEVMRMIIAKNRRVLLQKTHQHSLTAVTALWQSHLQSIPGLMAVAKILNGQTVVSSLFEKFWSKVTLMACEGFRLSPACPDVNDRSDKYLLHGLLFLQADFKLLKLALKRNRAWASYPDKDGNYVLHTVIRTQPSPGKMYHLINLLIDCCPEAAGRKNTAGDLPIFLAIRQKIAWKDGTNAIALASPDAVGLLDRETGLYPALLAAHLGSRYALDITYELLCIKPDIMVMPEP